MKPSIKERIPLGMFWYQNTKLKLCYYTFRFKRYFNTFKSILRSFKIQLSAILTDTTEVLNFTEHYKGNAVVVFNTVADPDFIFLVKYLNYNFGKIILDLKF